MLTYNGFVGLDSRRKRQNGAFFVAEFQLFLGTTKLAQMIGSLVAEHNKLDDILSRFYN